MLSPTRVAKRRLFCVFLMFWVCGAWAGPTSSAPGLPLQSLDSDDDGVLDGGDNCIDVGNPLQQDTDNDGIGNACDADLNNDCIVNVNDLEGFRAAFFTSDIDADFNSDGAVNIGDLGILRTLFLSEPGPSGRLNSLCTPDQPASQFMFPGGQIAFDNRRVISLDIADFDGDSIPDLITADPFPGGLTVWYGSGDGRVLFLIHISEPTRPY